MKTVRRDKFGEQCAQGLVETYVARKTCQVTRKHKGKRSEGISSIFQDIQAQGEDVAENNNLSIVRTYSLKQVSIFTYPPCVQNSSRFSLESISSSCSAIIILLSMENFSRQASTTAQPCFVEQQVSKLVITILLMLSSILELSNCTDLNMTAVITLG